MVCYAMIEMPGIQAFIGATGKLKEMVGGSEVVDHLTKGFLDDVLTSAGLIQIDEPDSGHDHWFIPLQRAAGTIRLVLASRRRGNDLLTAFSHKALSTFPGLPLLGTLSEFDWQAPDALMKAGREAGFAVNRKRSSYLASSGLAMLPVLHRAALDGQPTVERTKENDEAISLVSRCRAAFARQANQRLSERHNPSILSILQRVCQSGFSPEIEWALDYERLFPTVGHRYLAFIHIDGNDIGQAIESQIASGIGCSSREQNQRMQEFSEGLKKDTETAFTAALLSAVEADLKRDATRRELEASRGYIIPVRPLILGGDDITAVVRADLALGFVATFVESFERETEKRGKRFTAGIGMVITQHTYPFTRAYGLMEELIEHAKQKGKASAEGPASSIDFLVISGEMECDLTALRQRIYRADDGSYLTAKPLRIDNSQVIADFLTETTLVATSLPRGAVKRAVESCRLGKNAATLAHRDLRENIKRGLGGRKGGSMMTLDQFSKLFPEGSFITGTGPQSCCRLLDYAELFRFVEEG